MNVIQVHSDIYWHGVFSMHFGVLKIALMLCMLKQVSKQQKIPETHLMKRQK